MATKIIRAKSTPSTPSTRSNTLARRNHAATPAEPAASKILARHTGHAAPVPCSPLTDCHADQASGPFHAAFESTAVEREKLANDVLLLINTDIPGAVTVALAAAPRLLALRAVIASTLPTIDLVVLDRLELYAAGAGYAHSRYLATAVAQDTLPQLGAEGIKLRDILITNAAPLAQRGILPADRLAQVRNGVGYQDIATDLVTLAAMFRARGDNAIAQTTLQPEELTRAETLAREIQIGVGEREQVSSTATEVTRDRQRAFTLFARAYDEVRRAVTFLRWHEGDADQVAPSIYVRPGLSARRKETSTSSTSPASPASDGAAASDHTAASATPATPATNDKPPFAPAPAPAVPAMLTDAHGTVPVSSPFAK